MKTKKGFHSLFGPCLGISALVGIALREGYIADLDQKMMDFFPEYASPGLDPQKQENTKSISQ